MWSQLPFALVSGIVLGAVYGLFALGIVLVYRGTRVINFAAPELGAFALFLAYTMHREQGVNWVTAAIIGGIAAGAIALLFERWIVRRMGLANPLAIAVATIGLMLLLISLEMLIWDGSPRFMPGPIEAAGLTVAGFVVTPTQMIALATAVVLGVGLTQFLRRTDFGLGVQAAAMDPQAVRLVGVRFVEVSGFVWGVAGLLAAVAVLLAAPPLGAFAPGTMSATFFVPSLAAALLGGLDDLNGAFIGGLAVGIVDQVSRQLLLSSSIPAPNLIVVFVVIMLVLLFAPNGLPAALRDSARRPRLAEVTS
jgi:branched-chain amino acid transport system permease protein